MHNLCKKALLAIVILLNASAIFSQTVEDSNNTKHVAPWFVQRFKISGGLFVPVNNTNIQVGVNNKSVGTEIDFENDLGFSKVTPTIMGGLQWRASRRSRFDFTYYLLNRSTKYTLKKDIVFGEDTFNINSNVKSFFNTGIFRISYGYALLAKPKYELGLLFGVHVVGIKTGISLSGANVSGSLTSDYNVTAPLPDFGIWGGYAFNDRFAINGEADYLGITINDISGRIIAYNIALNYRVLDALHIGLGYTGLNFKVDAVKDKLNGHLKWGYNGPALTATYAFGKKKWVTD